MVRRANYVGKTEYISVYEMKGIASTARSIREPNFFSARRKINGKEFRVSGRTAKAVATALDIKLIESGLEPINVLNRLS